MDSEKKTSLQIVVWGVGLIGIGAYIVVIGMTITRLLNGSHIYWGRGIIILIIGTACILFSKKTLNKIK